MGLTADAELVWGIPVLAYDEDGEPTRYYSEDDEDWREFEDLTVRTYGHYEDPDGPRGILTTERVEPLQGSCWEPLRLSALPSISDKVPSKANDAARAADLDVDFYTDADWHLVASYG